MNISSTAKVPMSQGEGDNEFVRRVLRRWGLGEPRRIVELPVGWRAEISGRPFLLRDHGPASVSRRQLVFRHQVITALDQAGLPVAAPVSARTGRTVVQAAQRRYALYPWIDGKPSPGLDLSLDQCNELGALLGRLHRALDEFTAPVQQTLLVPTTRAAPALARITRLLADLPDGSARGDFDSLAERRLRERHDLLLRLTDHEPPEMETLTTGYVHGGFHFPNLLYGRTRGVTAILGWGRMKIGSFAGDLVRAATTLFAYGDDRGLDLERIEPFVRGHAEVFRLEPEQIQSAVHRLWWELLCDIESLQRRYIDHDHCLGAAPLVSWWTTHLDRTLEVFADGGTPDAANRRRATSRR